MLKTELNSVSMTWLKSKAMQQSGWGGGVPYEDVVKHGNARRPREDRALQCFNKMKLRVTAGAEDTRGHGGSGGHCREFKTPFEWKTGPGGGRSGGNSAIV